MIDTTSDGHGMPVMRRALQEKVSDALRVELMSDRNDGKNLVINELFKWIQRMSHQERVDMMLKVVTDDRLMKLLLSFDDAPAVDREPEYPTHNEPCERTWQEEEGRWLDGQRGERR